MSEKMSKRLLERLRGEEDAEHRMKITRQMVRSQLERASALQAKLQVYLQAGVDDKKRSVVRYLQQQSENGNAAQQRAVADLIYNRYYTQGGICDMLLRFEDYVMEEMEDLPDAQQIKSEVQANYVRVLLYGFERLKDAVSAQAQEHSTVPQQITITEEVLLSFGWRPVGARIEALREQLLGLYADSQALEQCTLQSWNMLTVALEECTGLFLRNRKSVTAALDLDSGREESVRSAGNELALYRTLKELFEEEPFSTLKDPQADAELFEDLAEEFVNKARRVVIDPYDRDA